MRSELSVLNNELRRMHKLLERDPKDQWAKQRIEALQKLILSDLTKNAYASMEGNNDDGPYSYITRHRD